MIFNKPGPGLCLDRTDALLVCVSEMDGNGLLNQENFTQCFTF